MTGIAGDAESLTALLWAGAGDHAVVVLGPGGRAERATSREILSRAEGVAGGLAGRGVGRGSRAGVILSTTVAAIVCAVGVLRSGATLVPLPPPPRVGSRARWMATVEALSAAACVREVVGPDIPRDRHAAVPPMPHPGDEALVTFTSGTTGSSRAVVHTQAALAAGVRMTEELATAADCRVSWMPLHQRGLRSDVLKPLAFGATSVLLRPESFAAQPMRWLAAISEHRGTTSGAPSSGYRRAGVALESAPGSLELDLSSWRTARCGGERVEPDDLSRFARAAAPYGFDAVFSASYASTEAGMITRKVLGGTPRAEVIDRAAFSEGRAEPVEGRAGISVVSQGYPAEGVAVEVRDVHGAPRPEREVGEIVVSSPAAMSGYLDDPAATAEVIVDGWVRTGDLGYLADGELFVVGRLKDTIIIGGRTWSASDIEEALSAGDDVEACAAVSVRGDGTDELALAVESAVLSRTEISARLWRELGLVARDVRVLPPGLLPRSATGKLLRARIREELFGGAHA